MEEKDLQSEIEEKRRKYDKVLSKKFIQLSFTIPVILSLAGMGIGYLATMNKPTNIQKIALIIGTLIGLFLSIGYGFVVEYIVKRRIANSNKEKEENETKENNKNVELEHD
ncbi:MAG: hypothetical protein K9W46_10540 [Candidatus Heimdallarchaeum endolithica]|uniref:Uncharacterized protein n=1 Tax=Candidatus Heimdallarchaeum endolithica TaxID=2876572 RepID=A0A9Y1FNE1_9ARCH|nr:MAG: hypothetical protein K9W46_10540 [Candidatus Heimdallarchaeum endolithica]